VNFKKLRKKLRKSAQDRRKWMKFSKKNKKCKAKNEKKPSSIADKMIFQIKLQDITKENEVFVNIIK